METKDNENMNTSLSYTRKCVKHPDMNFGGRKYDTQFNSIRKKKTFYAWNEKTRPRCGIHRDDSKEENQGAWIEGGGGHV